MGALGAPLSLHSEDAALRDLNTSYFPFTKVESAEAWPARRDEIQRRVLLAAGLWPMPSKPPVNAVRHGTQDLGDYTVEKVYLESLPGHFVTGNLYLPKKIEGQIPAVLCPHGHWPKGRFMRADDAEVKKQIAMGAETLENGARSPLQARCVHLARMGCAVFHFDTLGNADSIQFPEHRHGPTDTGFVSIKAENQLCGYFNLQTWNSIRAFDFLAGLPFVDQKKLGVTGASGGATQTMMLSGIDQRVAAAYPTVMVSTAMQGGCTCENANHLRVGQGNVDIAALVAPRPLGMAAADDWTKELETKGFPDLKQLYTLLGHPDDVEAHYNIQFPHNYNGVSRGQMYAFFNKHFALGKSDFKEADFTLLSPEQMTVWDDQHPKPSGDAVGLKHEEAVIAWFQEEAQKALQPALNPASGGAEWKTSRAELLGAWQTLVAGRLPKAQDVSFALASKVDRGDHLLLRGTVNAPDHALDSTFLYPKTWNNRVVLWLSLKGEASLFTSNGTDLNPGVRQLISEGFSVACPVLDSPGAEKNPNVYGKRKLQTYEGYAGYHYGYNPSLFARRVQDAMIMIALVRGHEKYRADQVQVAGSEGAGSIAACATALAGSIVDRLVVDTEGFRFASLTDVWDARYIPGAVKYGDVPGLLGLCAPTPLKVLNDSQTNLGGVEANYRAANNSSGLEIVKTPAVGAEGIAKQLVSPF